MSGRAVEAAGDIDVLLLDKTGTITLGNRMAVAFHPAPGIKPEDLADCRATRLAGRRNAGRPQHRRARQGKIQPARPRNARAARHLRSVHRADAHERRRSSRDGYATRLRSIRKGAADSFARLSKQLAAVFRRRWRRPSMKSRVAAARRSSSLGRSDVLGVIELKDVVKGGIKERFAQLRKMGIRTVMITGDNPLTAAAIAAEAGVDDFMAQATPEQKLQRIRDEQAAGHLVAMTGDGTNDAPALAQADVGVAMNTGTQAAREAGNMVDLDSNPTKLIEIVEIGKQLLMTRGSLTTFSIANDVAKYFAIIPAMLMATFPAIAPLNIMGLHSPTSAILSAVIFNALIIIALIPLALRGVAYKPIGALAILQRNLLIYGLGGIIVPFIGIKLIDVLITALNLA